MKTEAEAHSVSPAILQAGLYYYQLSTGNFVECWNIMLAGESHIGFTFHNDQFFRICQVCRSDISVWFTKFIPNIILFLVCVIKNLA